MIKKVIAATAVGVVAVAAFKGTKAFDYARQHTAQVREWAEGQVPPEMEVKRLRHEIKGLDQDITRVVTHLARENVEVRELRERVAEFRSQQAAQKVSLQTRGDAIRKGGEYVTNGGKPMPVAEAKAELDAAVRRFSLNQKTLDGLEQTLGSRERTREVLDKQLDTLKKQKLELASAVDALEAELNVLKLQQMESKYQTDDTRLAGIKESLREMRKKIDVERERLKLAPAVYESPAGPAAAAKSVDEILAPLGDAKTAAIE